MPAIAFPRHAYMLPASLRRALLDVQVPRSPPRASPSAGSCVPAIGYPYVGPGALAGGPGSRARDRCFHGQFRSAANAGAAEKGISVSMMCDCEGKVAPTAPGFGTAQPEP